PGSQANRAIIFLLKSGAVLRHNSDILGPRAFGTASFGILDMLSFTEAVEIHVSLDGRAGEDDISPLALNESESLVSQLLNRTLRHCNTLLTRKQLVNLQPACRALQAN